MPSEHRDDGSMVGEVVGWRLTNSTVKVYFPKEAMLPGRRVIEIASRTAKTTIQREIKARATQVQRDDLKKVLGVSEDDMLWKGLAHRFLISLTEPPLGMIPTLKDAMSEGEIHSRTQLFWRCLVGLITSPISRLQMMSKRRGKEIEFEKEESEMSRKLEYAKYVLPWFSMVASFQKEVAPTTPTPTPTPTQTSKQPEKIPERPVRKEDSAAKHTYDVGYKKWENFQEDKSDLTESELDTELTTKVQNASPKVREELSKLAIYENILEKKKPSETDTKKIQNWKASVLRDWKNNSHSKYRRQFRSQKALETWIQQQTTKALQRKYPSEREKESIRQMEEID